ncbi:MAG: nucleoside deaminase [Chlamydiae bacterium]|nr:nucleoside deaminase [Chlamydiota bacterium]
MELALQEARVAFNKGEVPVGAVLVEKNKVLSKAHNQVEFFKDATCHAEILCLKEASQTLGDFRLQDTTLYVTVEPCIMCFGASILSRVKKIIWGCSDKRHGALGGLLNLSELRHPIHQVDSFSGLMQEEARHLMQTFFQKIREEKKRARS